MKRAALLLIAACGTNDPCDGESACITLHVSSPTIHTIDQLELDLLWGTHHETTTTQNASATTDLPLVTAIVLDPAGATTLGVVVAGKLSGTVLGTAAGSSHLPTGDISLVLVAPKVCVAGSRYCGGDKVAGDAATLYECNGGGVPHAIMACANGCTVTINDDDQLRTVVTPSPSNLSA